MNRSFFALLTAAMFLLISTTGCIMNTRPLSTANEFKAPGLSGLWRGVGEDKKSNLFYVDDCGDHFKLYCMNNYSPSRFTIARITSPDRKQKMDTISWAMPLPAETLQQLKIKTVYLIFGYDLSKDHIALLNIDPENAKLKAAINALPHTKESKLLDAKPEQLREVLAKNMNAFKRLPSNFYRTGFKDQRSKEVFMACANFLPDYETKLQSLFQFKNPQAELKKLHDSLLRWRQENTKLLPESFKEIIDAHLRLVVAAIADKSKISLLRRGEVRNFINKIEAAGVKELTRQ